MSEAPPARSLPKTNEIYMQLYASMLVTAYRSICKGKTTAELRGCMKLRHGEYPQSA